MISPKLQALIQAVVCSASDDGCSDDLTVASKGAIEALAGYVKPNSQEEYVAHSGSECPFCRSGDIEYAGRARCIVNKAYHDCKCGDCGKAWIKVYSLTGYKS